MGLRFSSPALSPCFIPSAPALRCFCALFRCSTCSLTLSPSCPHPSAALSALRAPSGLEYLHKGCKPPIIHRDVKCSNILLDQELEGRISDFGISRSKLADTHMTVTNVMGTVGYIAPEYADLRITEKIDVFAFGVVLLEVVSGRRTFEGSQHITHWVRPLLNESRIQNIVDASIAADYNLASMWKVLEVAMACVEHEPERRPYMPEVSSELSFALSFELQNETVTLTDDSCDLPFDTLNVVAR